MTTTTVPAGANELHGQATTHELGEGDVVLHYGVYFLLTNRKTHGMRENDSAELQGDCVTFVGLELARAEHSPMPRHWTKDGYNIQGNKLATWLTVSAE